MINKNSSYYEIFWIFCYLGVAQVFVNCNIRSKVLLISYIFVSLFFIFQALSGINAQNALNTGSGNNISTIVLLYLFLLYIKRSEENKPIILWPAFMALVISIWGNGRGGLVTCLILIVLIYLYKFIHEKKGKISNLIKIAILIIIVIFFISHFFQDYFLAFIAKANKYGNTSIRVAIWKEYGKGVFKNMTNMFFGAPTISSDYRWLTYYSGNIHNAFLIAHSKFGMIGLGYIIIELIKCSYRFFKNKQFILIILLIAWSCRSFFDWTGFLGMFDIIFWCFLIKSRKLIEK